jgi:hypothetical protein
VATLKLQPDRLAVVEAEAGLNVAAEIRALMKQHHIR